MVAQERCGKMFYGVERASAYCRLAVGLGHAYVEGGDDITRGGEVGTRYVDTAQELVVVHCEACYPFHILG